jgi:hypothetical protein
MRDWEALTGAPVPPAGAVVGRWVMPGSGSWPGLRGRRRERDRLNGLVAAAKAGRSQVLVLRGQPGIGKTALLDFLVERPAGCQVRRVAGVESEMELPFAGLHQLCSPDLDRLDDLPAPQRDALRTTFGMRLGSAPDRFLVGLAVLTLLSRVAEEQPLTCVVDDAQWLDQASARILEFVARRLAVEPVAMVFAVRETDEKPTLTGLPELVLRGLGDLDARALLEAAVPGTLDPRVRDGSWPRARAIPSRSSSCREGCPRPSSPSAPSAGREHHTPGAAPRAGVPAPGGIPAAAVPAPVADRGRRTGR